MSKLACEMENGKMTNNVRIKDLRTGREHIYKCDRFLVVGAQYRGKIDGKREMVFECIANGVYRAPHEVVREIKFEEPWKKGAKE